MKLVNFTLLSIVLLLFVVSCNTKKDNPIDNPKGMNNLVVADNFNWSTASDALFQVRALDNTNQPIKGAKINIYTSDPLEGGKLIVSGATNDNGIYQIDYEVPAYYQSLFVTTDYVGLPSPGAVELTDHGFSITLGGQQANTMVKSAVNLKDLNTDFAYLGGFNSQGVPDYLEPQNDIISQGLLNDINNTLPEGQPLPQSHPEYLLPQWDYNLHLIEDCDVWITFVHERAGYKNVLGFYSYPTGQTPQTPADHRRHPARHDRQPCDQ